jgi:hypothetical protein
MPDLGSTSFSQTDSSNDPAGSAAPNTIDNNIREIKGAVTREWNHRSYTVTAGGTADAKTLTYSVAPDAYRNGQRYAFIANTTNTGSVTVNVNSLGAKTVKSMLTGTLANLSASQMVAGVYVEIAYNTANDCFVWTNQSGGVNPQFTTIELGHASDTTLSRASAGVVAVEGTNLVKAGALTASGLTIGTDKIAGRDTAGTGAIEEIGLGTGLGISSASLVLNGPAFSVNKNGTNQTGVADDTATKVTWSTEVFDTNSNFDVATNHRFTPTVAGYYLITGAVAQSGSGLANESTIIRKNGTDYLESIGNNGAAISAVISMNGSTDYVELFAYATVSSGTITYLGATDRTQFSGCFLRGL